MAISKEILDCFNTFILHRPDTRLNPRDFTRLLKYVGRSKVRSFLLYIFIHVYLNHVLGRSKVRSLLLYIFIHVYLNHVF